MKNFFAIFLVATLFLNSIFADSGNNVQEIRLENGLTVFILEDYNSPLIRIEYITKAGISSQNENTAGFFTLYSRIFESNLKAVSGFEVECNSDATRYAVTIPPSELKATLDLISKTAFSPFFPDEIIRNELNILKNEVLENENSLPGFINAAIDSRVFSGAPWKHDSGIYPALFNRIDFNQARIVLNEISEKYYTPQNSALFVSGNIETENLKSLLDLTFGIYYSATGVPAEKPAKNLNEKRKFVLHHPELSDEMTQIVMQYTGFNSDQCDLLAAVLNNDFSIFKYSLLRENKLGILGNEYINISPARKKDSSRLILQSLLQTIPNVSPFDQTNLFITTAEGYLKNLFIDEIERAKLNLTSNSNFIFENSVSFMKQLASYWAIKDFDTYTPDDISYSNYQNSPTTAAMMTRSQKIDSIDIGSLIHGFENESPYIFVILNSKTYEKYKTDFKNADFEEISTTNASWYSQELFKHIKQAALDSFTEQNKKYDADSDKQFQNTYYTNNKNSVRKITLSNNIPVYIKQNDNSSFTTILLDIKGGKLNSITNNGFEELMVNILSSNIQNEIYTKSRRGLILSSTSVYSNTNLTSSQIIVECSSSDFDQCINAISNSILYTEVIPSLADRIVSNLQYKKRLENGDSNYQMFAQTIGQLYGKKNLYAVYEAEKDILQKVDFDEIVNSYSQFLNSSRYSIVLTGSVPSDFKEVLEFELKKLKPSTFTPVTIDKINYPVKTQSFIRINHTFLTDVPASKAGKMPAKLIPTTEFIDPVIYIFKKPEDVNEQYLCSAFKSYIISNFPEVLNKNSLNIPLSQNKTSTNNNLVPKPSAITLTTDSNLLGFQGLLFKNVARAGKLESLYTKEITDTITKLSSIYETSSTLQKIKNNWSTQFFADGISNTGVAILVNDSLIESDSLNPEKYIEEFKIIQDATAEDFIRIIEKYFLKPELMLLSTDAKKQLNQR